jgi:hypothetical protein
MTTPTPKATKVKRLMFPRERREQQRRFAETAAQHQAADAAVGRDWSCACAACRATRDAEGRS